VLLVAILNNLLNFAGVSSYWQWVVQGGIIIIAVGLHRSRGKAQ
jgi:ribose transport system permease protein